MPRAQDDARLVAAQIVNLLREHWRSTPNDRADKAVTSYRQNQIGNGMIEAIKVIAEAYDLDVSDPDSVGMKFK